MPLQDGFPPGEHPLRRVHRGGVHGDEPTDGGPELGRSQLGERYRLPHQAQLTASAASGRAAIAGHSAAHTLPA